VDDYLDVFSFHKIITYNPSKENLFLSIYWIKKQVGYIQSLIASEGLWIEPASAAGLAGMMQEVNSGRLNIDGKTIVTVCTGHGMKDPDVITSRAPKIPVIPPVLAQLEQLLLE
jgi:threonine synthase